MRVRAAVRSSVHRGRPSTRGAAHGTRHGRGDMWERGERNRWRGAGGSQCAWAGTTPRHRQAGRPSPVGARGVKAPAPASQARPPLRWGAHAPERAERHRFARNNGLLSPPELFSSTPFYFSFWKQQISFVSTWGSFTYKATAAIRLSCQGPPGIIPSQAPLPPLLCVCSGSSPIPCEGAAVQRGLGKANPTLPSTYATPKYVLLRSEL